MHQNLSQAWPWEAFQRVFARPAAHFLFGAGGYGLIEIAWRGFTHPSMLILGGVCFACLMRIGKLPMGIFRKSSAGAGLITILELVTGYIVNIRLELNVWNYANLRWNFMGQICPLYTVLWFFLCLVVFGVHRALSLAAKASSL